MCTEAFPRYALGVDDLAATLGRRLREARQQRGWKLIDVAARCDDSPTFQSLSLIERGVHAPSVATLRRLAVALEVSTDQLLGIDDRREQAA